MEEEREMVKCGWFYVCYFVILFLGVFLLYFFKYYFIFDVCDNMFYYLIILLNYLIYELL